MSATVSITPRTIRPRRASALRIFVRSSSGADGRMCWLEGALMSGTLRVDELLRDQDEHERQTEQDRRNGGRRVGAGGVHERIGLQELGYEHRRRQRPVR